MMNPRRITLTLGAAAGGLLAAAFLPMAIANADNTLLDFEYSPNFGSFNEIDGLGVGLCPTPLCTEIGNENWNVFDFTHPGSAPNSLMGIDTYTNIGTFTNDLILVQNNTQPAFDGLAPGSLIDFTDYGFGFKNELVDTLFTSSMNQGIADILFINTQHILLFAL